ncbi:MAG: carbonic anhydrase [Bdellovibrionia bacterium]
MLSKVKPLLTVASLAVALCGASGGHSSQSALQDLVEGNKRFASGQATHCGIDDQKLASHQASQAPDAIILSCSDSRVPPERIFDQDIGELFTVRVAGNILNEDVVASIEYGVANLGSRLIVIMGHDSCGAIKAAVSGHADEDAGSASLNHLIQEIRDNLGIDPEHDASLDPTLRNVARKNVSAVAADLLSRSKIVREAVQAGKVKIERSIYTLSSGKVDFWE